MNKKEIDAFIERVKAVAIARIGVPLANKNEAKMHAIAMRIVSLEQEKNHLLDTVERYRVLCRKHNISLE